MHLLDTLISATFTEEQKQRSKWPLMVHRLQTLCSLHSSGSAFFEFEDIKYTKICFIIDGLSWPSGLPALFSCVWSKSERTSKRGDFGKSGNKELQCDARSHSLVCLEI